MHMASNPGLYQRMAHLHTIDHNGHPYCPKCFNKLDVSGGVPLPCSCNWRKHKPFQGMPKPQPMESAPAVTINRKEGRQEQHHALPDTPSALNVKFGGQCRYCGQVVSRKRQTKLLNGETIDHFIPMCVGGQNIARNRVLSCERCNTALKGNLNPKKVLEVWAEIDLPGLQSFVAKLTKQHAKSDDKEGAGQ